MMREFIAKSPSSLKALNTLRVSASLPVNILVVGEEGVGKKSLVRSVFKDIKEVGAKDVAKSAQKELFVTDLEQCVDIVGLMKRASSKRIIATSTKMLDIYEEFFPVILHLPPLKERKEDLKELKRLYMEELRSDFGIELKEDISPDISQNAISLKRDIYLKGLLSSMSEDDLLYFMQRHLEPRLEEGYKKLLYLFDVPILRAARKKYGSNLAISKALELNRATVTSKINRYKDFIE